MDKRDASEPADYSYFAAIQTRWIDNDAYGHVNNAVYYSFFDTAVSMFLIERGVFDRSGDQPIALVVGTQCQYFTSLSFPDELEVGVAVASLGNTSVRYDVAIFRKGSALASARGEFIHVYVDPHTRRSVALPQNVRRALQSIGRCGGHN